MRYVSLTLPNCCLAKQVGHLEHICRARSIALQDRRLRQREKERIGQILHTEISLSLFPRLRESRNLGNRLFPISLQK